MSGRARIALGVLVLAYVPVLAYVVIVTTPSYSLLPRVWIVAVPAALASFSAGLMLSARAVQFTAWAVVAVAAAALLDNAVSIVAYLADWEKRRGTEELQAWLTALRQSGAHLWHWAVLLAPSLVAAGVLLKARAGRPLSPRR